MSQHEDLMNAIKEVKQETQSANADIYDIKVSMVHYAAAMESQEKRSSDLETIVGPLHEEKIKREVAEELKAQQKVDEIAAREDLVFKLKLPVIAVACLVAVGTVLAWVMGS